MRDAFPNLRSPKGYYSYHVPSQTLATPDHALGITVPPGGWPNGGQVDRWDPEP